MIKTHTHQKNQPNKQTKHWGEMDYSIHFDQRIGQQFGGEKQMLIP